VRYTVIEAAKIVGKSRQTIYRHIEKKPITVEKDDEDNVYIDASELLRVYGDKINFDAVNSHTSNTKSDNVLQTVTSNETQADLRVIKEQLNSANKQIEMLETRMHREKEILEDQISTMKDALEKSQEVQSKTVALLENKSEPSGVGTIQKTLSALEDRIERQEQSAREESEKQSQLLSEEKERTEKALSESRDYKKTVKLLYFVTGTIALILIAGAILSYQGALSLLFK
jgi:hypothetical protein